MTKQTPAPVAAHRGWCFPSNRAPKAHWINNENRSLCGKWVAFLVPGWAFENDGGDRRSSDECVQCRRRLDKLRTIAEANA